MISLCRILVHPATSDPQKWLYEILKILQMLLASNILDPLKWLDDMLWTLPENPIAEPWPSSYLRPPEMALWDIENPPNILSIQNIRPPSYGSMICCEVFLWTVYRILDIQSWVTKSDLKRKQHSLSNPRRSHERFLSRTEAKVLFSFCK